jgi:O-antigen/teichoic acid export membrane protein
MRKVISESKLLAKHSLIYGLGNFFNRIAAFLLLPIYTRFLTPHDYGIKELVGLTTDVIGVLLATAIASAIYRFYFEYEDIKDRNEVISSAIITISCFGLFAILLLSLATKTMARYILDSPTLYYFFLLSFASMWFQSLNNIGYNYLRANQQSLKFVTLQLGKMLVVIGLNIYLVCFVKLGVLGILISTLISSIAMCFILILPLCLKTHLRFSYTKVKAMLKFGLPVIPAQLGAFVVHISDRFFIKAYCSIADAGLYSLGYRFGALTGRFVSDPFNQTWQPRRFELYKEEGSEELFGRIFTYFLALMFFGGLAISVLTKDVLIIIADERFWSAYKVVPIIVLATTIFSFHYHLNMGILITKKTKYLAYINFSNAVFILLLNFLLIPKYGVYGAAFATLIAFVYKVSLTYYFSSKYYKIYFEFIRIGKILLAAAVLYFVTLFIEFPSIYINFSLKSGIIFLYPLLLYAFRFYSIEEKQKAAEFVKPRLLSMKRLFRTQIFTDTR